MISTARKLISFLEDKSRVQLYFLLFPMVLVAALEMLSIGMIIPFIQVIMSDGDSNSLSWLPTQLKNLPSDDILMLTASAFAIFFVVKNTFILVMIFIVTRFSQRALAQFMQKLFGLYLKRDYTFFLQRNSSEVVRNLSHSASSAFDGLRLGLNMAMDALLTFAACLLLLIVAPKVTVLAGLTLLVLGVGIYKVLGPLLVGWGKQAFMYEAKVIQSINQAFGSIKDIKVLNCQESISQPYRQQTDHLANYATRSITANQSPRLFIETTMVIGFLIVIFALLEMHGSVNDVISTIGVFGMAALRLMPSMNRIVSGTTEFRHRTALVESLYQDLQDGIVETEKQKANFVDDPISFNHEVKLDEIKFNYPGTNGLALDSINFSINKGASIGLVGESGSGKTTLADIFLGLLTPQSGKLLVDGQNAFTSLQAWQRHLGYVPQSIYILDDTLRNNIAFGILPDDIDDASVMDAIKLAQFESVLKDLPQGLDTRLGEQGARLSGGQRQRVGIARALYRKPNILVFDEATSSLDSETELDVTKAIEALSGTKTLIIIAHRLSTVRKCDQIVFMSDGQVSSIGTFDELQNENPEFRRLVELSELNQTLKLQ
jgi:ATP-binding cassette, subfamily B, bacterial PglK